MDNETILNAEKHARRFLNKLKAVKDRAINDKYTFYGCKETGDLKRVSMDLTRSLARLRK